MNQQRMHARSANIKEEGECDNEAETALDNGVKTRCVYAATIGTRRIYTDQYIQIKLDDSLWLQANDPLKNRTTAELLR
jgi:hypothetical protein